MADARSSGRPFADRVDAGRRLAEVVRDAGPFERPIVLGLPRGGVPVAHPVAEALAAPLDVLVVRKLGAPSNEEVAMGAIGPGGIRVLDDRIAGMVGADDATLGRIEKRESAELERREQVFRAGRDPLDLTGRTAVIVDDGVATGATAGVACRVARAMGAARVVLAVPVAPSEWRERIGPVADDFLAVREEHDLWAVGQYYRDFRQTTDDEVLALLRG
jgi:putative phosphoribosyl transferase